MSSIAFYPLFQNDSLLSSRSGAHRQLINNAARNISPNIEFDEHSNAYVVSADLPGLGEEDVKLEVHHGVLSIAAEKKVETKTEGEDGKPVTVSRTLRSFRHSFKLPEDVDEEGISAEMDKGILALNLPKKPEASPRRIALGGPKPSTPK